MSAEKIFAKRPSVHGHRGSRGTHPENCLPSFLEAANAGADFIELDVYLTCDDVPVVFHDWIVTSARATHWEGATVSDPVPIMSLSRDELRGYDVGSVPQKAFPKQKLYPRTEIPILAEVLDWLRQFPRKIELNMDIKAPLDSSHLNPNPDKMLKTVFSVLDRYQWTDKTFIQSNDYKIIQAARQLRSDMRVGFQIYEDLNFPKTAKQLGLHFVTVDYPLVTATALDQCREYGITVYVFTVNSESEWKHCFACGVDGIITDYPRNLVELLSDFDASSG